MLLLKSSKDQATKEHVTRLANTPDEGITGSYSVVLRNDTNTIIRKQSQLECIHNNTNTHTHSTHMLLYNYTQRTWGRNANETARTHRGDTRIMRTFDRTMILTIAEVDKTSLNNY